MRVLEQVYTSLSPSAFGTNVVGIDVLSSAPFLAECYLLMIRPDSEVFMMHVALQEIGGRTDGQQDPSLYFRRNPSGFGHMLISVRLSFLHGREVYPLPSH